MKPELSSMAMGEKRWVSYLKVTEGKFAKTIELNCNLFIDVDEEGKLLGVELLGPVNFTDDQLSELTLLESNTGDGNCEDGW